jgi:hypothetical protein
MIAGPAPEPLLRKFGKPKGTPWRTAFGTDADEYFQAWNVASYINTIAAAGKAEKTCPCMSTPLCPAPLAASRPTLIPAADRCIS